ncbi:MAG: flagellar basal body P-ring protein FlgI [Planctomycetota bacterium]|nr:flagellar basal body P-ring protein FlgI [Planctomycetota bacterium]
MKLHRHILATLFLLAVFTAAPAWAVQVQDLVRLKGSETSTLVGMGLVVGLKGTGDGGKYLPAMRPLAQVTQHLLDPNTNATELKDAKNVAVVMLTATLPATGVREGDHVNIHVSAPAAKSLEGGRLFLIPMTGPMPDSPVFAYAEGPVTIENKDQPAVGLIRGGAQLVREVRAKLMDSNGRITLILNDPVASWPMANNIAALINGVVAPDGPAVARAVDPKNVTVDVPAFERTDPAAFISQILLTYIDPSQIGVGARVVINERTGTIIVSGEVQISPVIISHKGLTITTITPAPEPTPANPITDQQGFAALDPDKRGGAKLADLLAAFNQLKVEGADRVAIIRELHRSGKLHATLIEE